LDIYEREGLFERAKDLTPYFAQAMMSLKDHELVKDIRTIGLLSGLEVHPHPAPGARGGAMQKALFWNGCHVKFTGDVGIIAPQFVAERIHVDEIIDKVRKTLDQFV
jgi:beta-alanine--pyruvate transaminase